MGIYAVVRSSLEIDRRVITSRGRLRLSHTACVCGLACDARAPLVLVLLRLVLLLEMKILNELNVFPESSQSG